MNTQAWSGALASFRSIRPWQIIVLIVVLLGAGAGTYLVYSSLTGSESTELEEDQQLIPVQRGRSGERGLDQRVGQLPES